MRFHLVDRILEIEPARSIRTEMRFDPAEELFEDHFPGRPLVPGSLLVEAMAQTGGWLVLATDSFRRWPLLVMVERAKFREPTPPGASIELRADLGDQGGRRPALRGATVRLSTEARVGGRLVAQAACVYRLFDPDALIGDADAPRFASWARQRYAELLSAGSVGSEGYEDSERSADSEGSEGAPAVPGAGS